MTDPCDTDDGYFPELGDAKSLEDIVKPPSYTLTLTPVSGWSVPPSVRLKRALKTLLRGFGLRCVRIGEADEQHHEVADK